MFWKSLKSSFRQFNTETKVQKLSPNVLEFYYTVDSQNCVTHTIDFYELVNCKNSDLLTVWAFYQFIADKKERISQTKQSSTTHLHITCALHCSMYTKRNQLGFSHQCELEPLKNKSNPGVVEPGGRRTSPLFLE